MAIRSIFGTVLTFWTAFAAGQVSGQFYMEKSTFAPGEPVFLYFEVTNDGPKSVNLLQADPYSFCSGYQVSVSSDPGLRSLCGPGGIAGSCLSSNVALQPGKKRIERILLNFEHNISAPSDYEVDAVRHLDHVGTDVDYFKATKDTLEVRTKLNFRVDQNTESNPMAFQPWVNQLKSTDPEKRREAARTLASVAPPSLENTLLTFADNPEIRQFAPLAFYRLNTPRSMAAMADLLRKAEPGTFEHIKSADYLAESGDQQWFPLLREVAQKNANISSYVDDAAELGGDKMLPTLISLMNSPDKEFTRINAVTAVGSTGSRAAVPILLDLLRSPDTDIADRARYALGLLTHRAASDVQSGSPQSQYFQWAQWWAREGTAAPIYRRTECGDYSPLH